MTLVRVKLRGREYTLLRPESLARGEKRLTPPRAQDVELGAIGFLVTHIDRLHPESPFGISACAHSDCLRLRIAFEEPRPRVSRK
jgi:hypothetical protein